MPAKLEQAATELIVPPAVAGATVTATVKLLPEQVAEETGVTVYVAVWLVVVVFVSVPVILLPFPATPPVIPPVTDGADQLYVVPAGTMPSVPSTGETLNAVPVQAAAAITLIAGFGFTVTVTVKVEPEQPPGATGVTLEVAV